MDVENFHAQFHGQLLLGFFYGLPIGSWASSPTFYGFIKKFQGKEHCIGVEASSLTLLPKFAVVAPSPEKVKQKRIWNQTFWNQNSGAGLKKRTILQ